MHPGAGIISDEAVESLRRQIGVRREAQPWNSVASYDAIWHFALGVGDDNPLWWDRAYSDAGPWGRMFAPPTFLYSCFRGGPRNGRPPGGQPEFDLLPGVVGLWSRDRWVWHSPVFMDEPVRATTGVDAVRVRPGGMGGRSISLVNRVAFTDDDGRPLADLYSSVIFLDRNGAFGDKRYMDVPPARYSPDELDAISAQYDMETAQRRGPVPLYWEDVEIGVALLTILKGPLTMTNLVGWKQGWGSSLCPTNRIAHQHLRENPGSRLYNAETGVEDTISAVHWEPYFLEGEGMPRGYDYGSQRISWFAHLLTDWCGDEGFVTGLDVQLRRPNFFGDCTWLTGKVVGSEGHADLDGRNLPPGANRGYGSVMCELTATNQRGEKTAVGSATVALPRRRPA